MILIESLDSLLLHHLALRRDSARLHVNAIEVRQDRNTLYVLGILPLRPLPSPPQQNCPNKPCLRIRLPEPLKRKRFVRPILRLIPTGSGL